MVNLNGGDKPASAITAATLRIDTATGLVAGVRYFASPNADERPDSNDISLLVVHSISLPPGEFRRAGVDSGHIDDLFLNRLDPSLHPYFRQIEGLKVSAHACVFRDGSITQYVPTGLRAWHAGQSSFEGRDRCNDFSIGVELEGADEHPFTDAQYRSLARLTLAVLNSYPDITRDRIVGHADIAPLRKTDPGPLFDWQRLHFELEFPR